MSKIDEFRIKNEELCIKNEEFSIENDGSCRIVVIVQPIECDSDQVWLCDSESDLHVCGCEDCPFGTERNGKNARNLPHGLNSWNITERLHVFSDDPSTGSEEPCVCKQGTYKIKGGHFSYCFETTFVENSIVADHRESK